MSQLLERVYGQKPIIYTGQNFYNKHLSNRLPQHPLWIACYSNTPPTVNEPYMIWQFTQRAKLNGISTPVDLNLFTSKGNIKKLKLKN
jgi:lysozyme